MLDWTLEAADAHWFQRAAACQNRPLDNDLLTLLRHPHQLARLRADAALMDSAVEEMLRFERSVTVAQGRQACCCR